MAAIPAAARRRRPSGATESDSARAEPSFDRGAAIVAAATTALGREGFHSTSIKDIAAEAGVAPGLVHYYFASKEELLVAVLDGLCQEISRRWRTAIEGLTDPIDKIDAALSASAEWMRGHPEFYRIVFDLHAVGFTNEAVRRGLHELWERQIRDIEMEIATMYRENALPAVLPARELAAVVAATVDGVALHWLAHESDLDAAHRALKVILASAVAVAADAAGLELPVDRVVGLAARPTVTAAAHARD
jgi:AcrR family transcriptional regulator